MFRYVDIHAHLDDESFDPDRDEVLKRAADVMVFNAGQQPASNRKTLELATSFSNVRPCLGFHPEFFPKFSDDEIMRELDFIKTQGDKLIAMSEIGLDYKHLQRENRLRGRRLFIEFLKAADCLGLPVIVHSRDASSAVLEVLQEFGGTVVLHSFPGSMGEVEAAMKAGYFFSIAPSIHRSRQKQDLVQRVPLSQLLTESDSPVLGVTREVRNEPVNVGKSVEKIAEIKRESEEHVRQTLLQTAKLVFRLDM